MLIFAEISKDMNTALVYYTASLFEAIGKQYRRPSLEILVRFWFDSNGLQHCIGIKPALMRFQLRSG